VDWEGTTVTTTTVQEEEVKRKGSRRKWICSDYIQQIITPAAIINCIQMV
jgi:hypothetical protein